MINSLTSSEDKQLGYFFCQPDKEGEVKISKNLFVGKVIFYLWNEIFKDYAFDHDVCRKGDGEKSETLYFADFYSGKNEIKQPSLMTFFKNLDKNQPKIDDKEVKLIEEKEAVAPATETPQADSHEGGETTAETDTDQNEETLNENTEA